MNLLAITAGASALLSLGAAFGGVITLSTEVSGVVNGEPLAARGAGPLDPLTGLHVDGSVDDGTGHLESRLLFTQLPRDFPVIAYDKSWKCKHHSVAAFQLDGGLNLLSLGAVDHDFTETLTYPNGDVIFTTGSVRMPAAGHVSLQMTLQGDYTAAYDVIGAIGTTDALTPIGPGVARRTGSEILLLADGSTVTVGMELTMSFLDPSFELPFAEYLQMDVLTYAFDSGTSELTIVTDSTIRPVPASAGGAVLISGLLLSAGVRRRSV